ncbi:hypothetical protein VNO77_15999 [Canavalia gladiata]|uniref:Uncharacterized protein n=1 Tax=Canavalia gladiata TaxID=3824 RepID=A0AAN9QPJ0_CANGL
MLVQMVLHHPYFSISHMLLANQFCYYLGASTIPQQFMLPKTGLSKVAAKFVVAALIDGVTTTLQWIHGQMFTVPPVISLVVPLTLMSLTTVQGPHRFTSTWE